MVSLLCLFLLLLLVLVCYHSLNDRSNEEPLEGAGEGIDVGALASEMVSELKRE